MGTIFQDIRYGLRRLRHAPGFTLTALATLALGIGATTAIFTLTYQVILRSMPVEHPEQLYKVGKDTECCVDGSTQGHFSIFSYDLYRTLRDETPGIDGLAAVQAGSVAVSARREGDMAGEPLDVRLVSGNYFSVLGVKPLAGRLLTPEDDREGAPPVAVVSHAVWQSKFNRDPSLVGSSVMFSGHPFTIIGISAENFLGDRNTGDPAGVWVALANEPVLNPTRQLYHQFNAHWLDLIARISKPENVGPAESAMRVELLRWIRAHREPGSTVPESEIAKQTTELVPASDGFNDLRDQYEKSLTMLQLIAAFVLVIACANLANLMLVRGIARRQELSLRSALGASRSRLMREMLVESVTLAIFGGALGLFVSYLGVKAILAVVMQRVTIDPLSASPSLPVLLFAFGVSALTGVLFGIAPALMASQLNPAEALHGANRTTGHVSGLQRTLVILQSALSVALLSTAGLLILSLQRLQHQDFRFDTHGRLIAFVDLQAAGIRYDQLDNLYRQFDQSFASAPNLHDAAWATYSPMSYNNWNTGVAIHGGDPNANQTASYTFVSRRFFEAVGTRLLYGRIFSDGDTATSRHVAVVNQTFVKKYLNGQQPIGALFGPDPRMTTEYEIVGVVDDSKYGDPSQPTRPMFFMPLAQTTDYQHLNATQQFRDQATRNELYSHFASRIVVRYDGDTAAATAAVRRVIHQVNPDITIFYLATYDEQVGNYFTRQTLVVRLTAIFGAVALILASIGLYGVTAYGVARRIPEIGLRMALGADRASVVRLILQGAALQTVVGIAIGIPTALLAGHLLQSQLYEISGYNFSTIFPACAVLILSAIVASILPARRASSVEPIQALRAE
jgi:predicted permease